MCVHTELISSYLPWCCSCTLLVLLVVAMLLVIAASAAFALAPSSVRTIPVNAGFALAPPAVTHSRDACTNALYDIFAAEAILTPPNDLPSLQESLASAGFRVLTKNDVTLSRALNAGYLLRLSLEPQLSKLSPLLLADNEENAEELPYESRVLMFVRDVQVDEVSGILIGPKLACLQALLMKRLLQPVANAAFTAESSVERSIRMALARLSRRGLLPRERAMATRSVSASILSRRARYSGGFVTFGDDPLAAAINDLTKEGMPSGHVGLCTRNVERIGIADVFAGRDSDNRPAPRFGLAAVKALASILTTLIRRSTLKEPAFGQVVVVWQAQKVQPNSRAPLELRAYRDVPIANLEAVLPSTRLVFRPADALRLDLVTFVSIISAFFVTQRFTTLPTRLVASVAVALATLKSVFSYSNALARYDLRTASFRAQKLSVRGDEVHRSIALEAASQRARRAGMLLRWLTSRPGDGAPTLAQLEAESPAMISAWTGREDDLARNNAVNLKDAAAQLERLGLVTTDLSGRMMLAAAESPGVPTTGPSASKSNEAILQAYWNRLLRSR